MANRGEQPIDRITSFHFYGWGKSAAPNTLFPSAAIGHQTNKIDYPNIFKFNFPHQLLPKLVDLHVLQWFSPV